MSVRDSPLPVLIAAPMAGGATTPTLIRAAHAAGARGFLAAGNLAPVELADRMTDLRSTSTPFGVNLFTPSRSRVDPTAWASYRARLEPVARRLDVSLPTAIAFDDDHWHDKLDLIDGAEEVSFTFGLPHARVISHLRRHGTRVLVTVTNASEARAAADAGVDALIVQGSRAGGHSAAWDLHAEITPRSTTSLVQEIAATTPLPLIAAGGVAGPDDVTALLAAGASSVQVGTLLLRTPEAGTAAAHRAALVDPRFSETVLTRAFTGRWARSLRNAFTDDLSHDAPAGYPEVHRLTSPLRAAAAERPDPEALHLWAGTGFRAATTESAVSVLQHLASRT